MRHRPYCPNLRSAILKGELPVERALAGCSWKHASCLQLAAISELSCLFNERFSENRATYRRWICCSKAPHTTLMLTERTRSSKPRPSLKSETSWSELGFRCSQPGQAATSAPAEAPLGRGLFLFRRGTFKRCSVCCGSPPSGYIRAGLWVPASHDRVMTEVHDSSRQSRSRGPSLMRRRSSSVRPVTIRSQQVSSPLSFPC